MMIYGEHRVAR